MLRIRQTPLNPLSFFVDDSLRRRSTHLKRSACATYPGVARHSCTRKYVNKTRYMKSRRGPTGWRNRLMRASGRPIELLGAPRYAASGLLMQIGVYYSEIVLPMPRARS